MKRKLYDGVGCWSYVVYLLVWLGGTGISYYAITNKEHTEVFMIFFTQLMFLVAARVLYLEDLMNEVEKRMNNDNDNTTHEKQNQA